MSGLLVKSVAVMKENLEELNAQGREVPVLLGGAALTRDYAEDDLADLYNGKVRYCRDAFEGLAPMDPIVTGSTDAAFEELPAMKKRRHATGSSVTQTANPRRAGALGRRDRQPGAGAAVLGVTRSSSGIAARATTPPSSTSARHSWGSGA